MSRSTEGAGEYSTEREEGARSYHYDSPHFLKDPFELHPRHMGFSSPLHKEEEEEMEEGKRAGEW